MARFSSFLGRRVEVQYRASDILLPASGVFVADSGRSIFLEQSFEQRGQHRHFRWEIPYQHLVRIGFATAAEVVEEPAPKVGRQMTDVPAKELRAAGAAAGLGLVSAALPMGNRSKTA
jgi:hypothetical protein